ncbi:unnamed protein product [Caenorhabditis brenneri]
MVNKKIKTKYADIAPNKSGVPSRNISLTADPQACTVPAAGGASTHKLVNAGAEKLVFKIKSSNNKEYRISPVFGFIDPSGSKDLTITRTAGAPKGDKLVIYFGPAPADATDAQAAFGAITPAGTVTIPLSATEEKMTDLETEKTKSRHQKKRRKGVPKHRLLLGSKETWLKLKEKSTINRDAESMKTRWRKNLQSLDRLNELDDLQEKIKECLRKAFKDENDSEIDDSSSVSRSSVSRSSEVKVASIKVSLEVTVNKYRFF